MSAKRKYTCTKDPRQCANCNVNFHPQVSAVNLGRGKYCTRKCAFIGKKVPTDQRVWAKVNKTNDCWLWTGNLFKDGYGQIHVNGISCRVHRLVWELTHGKIPEGLCVLHRCDVRACCRIEHLFLGTRKDNAIDMVAKGRAPDKRGSNASASKLVESQVIEMRRRCASGESQKSLAKEFGVKQCTVSNIINRKRWKHV